MLGDEDRGALLALARAVVSDTAHRRETRVTRPANASPAVDEPRGAFVTLHSHGRLRGCIGFVEPREPLWQVVAEAARAAASRDPRFAPVLPHELPEIDFEISALTTPEPIAGPEEIEIGRDGLILESPGARGLLLPQVATEWEFGPEEFLDAVSQKAGLEKGAWREEGVRLLRFSAEVFS